ncbi:MAG: hypothetical protein JWO15_1719 [Sphingomonadales bacterium]|nr:hypothetical protein [Sphingomonadales bacterium]
MPAPIYTRPLLPSGHALVARPKDAAANRILSERTRQAIAFALPATAACYSAVLAMMVARGFPINTGMVILIEILLLATAGAYCFESGLRLMDGAPVLLIFGFIVTAIITTMIVGRPMVETLRSGAIIGLFTMVGHRASYATLDRLFLWMFGIVLAVLLLEVLWLQGYVDVFRPAAFYAATRGIQASEYNSTGLFNTATSFQGRFNFGVFSIPRASSIFLEQVSNGNFAAIGALYLSVRGKELGKIPLLLGIATIALVLVTTNSRFGSLLVVAAALGYFVYPLLPRAALPLVSLVLITAVVVISRHDINAMSDDFQGRLSFVGRKFRDYEIPFYLGLDAGKAVHERDSGYSFFIGTTSIFGMIGLWLYINLVPRMDDGPSRRLGWGLALYFLGQLIVSSTSLLTIKTAALLWFMVGCVRAGSNDPGRQSR